MSQKAVILTAPSGSGKTTLLRRLVAHSNDLEFSISAATRNPRERLERQGKDYYFISLADFKEKIRNRDFIEWEEVYKGKFYGTLYAEVERIWKAGKNVAFDIDVKGALNLKKHFGDRALAIFIKPPSLDTLKTRLLRRGTETPESLVKRLEKATLEMTFENRFDKVLINDTLTRSQAELQRFYDEFRNQ